MTLLMADVKSLVDSHSVVHQAINVLLIYKKLAKRLIMKTYNLWQLVLELTLIAPTQMDLQDWECISSGFKSHSVPLHIFHLPVYGKFDARSNTKETRFTLHWNWTAILWAVGEDGILPHSSQLFSSSLGPFQISKAKETRMDGYNSYISVKVKLKNISWYPYASTRLGSGCLRKLYSLSRENKRLHLPWKGIAWL